MAVELVVDTKISGVPRADLRRDLWFPPEVESRASRFELEGDSAGVESEALGATLARLGQGPRQRVVAYTQLTSLLSCCVGGNLSSCLRIRFSRLFALTRLLGRPSDLSIVVLGAS